MLNVHLMGYFTIKSQHWDDITIWRQCCDCHKSQWWEKSSGTWSQLRVHDFVKHSVYSKKGEI